MPKRIAAIQRGGRVQRRTLWVLSIITVLGGLGIGAALSVGALLMTEVSGSAAISGLASATFNGGAALAGIPLARLANRAGRRPAIIVGSLVAMVGAVLAIWSTIIGVWGILACGLALIGVASAVQLLSRFAATDLALPKHRARDLSLVVWSITIGAVVGPNLIGPGEAVGHWLGVTPLAGAFVFVVVAQGIAVLVAWFALSPDPLLAARLLPAETDTVLPLRATGSSTGGFVLSTDLPHWRSPQLLVVTMIALAQAIMVALMAMTPLHLMQYSGTAQIVGITLSLHIAGMYALAPLFGMFAGRFGSLSVVAAGWVIFFVAVVIAFIAGSSHLLVQVSLTLIGVGWGAVTVAGAALLTELTPASLRTRWQGRSDTTMNAAGAVAGLLAGVVYAVGNFSLLAVVSGVLLAFGLVAWLYLMGIRRGFVHQSPAQLTVQQTLSS